MFLLVWPLPIYIAMLHDYATKRLIHPVYAIGFAAMAAMRLVVPLRDSESWLELTAWLATFIAEGTAEAAIDATLAGIGLTCTLSYQIAAAVRAGQLAVVLRKFEPPPLPVSLIYVRETRITAKLRAFIDYAAPRLRASLTDAAI